jgi:hypothetical protein
VRARQATNAAASPSSKEGVWGDGSELVAFSDLKFSRVIGEVGTTCCLGSPVRC